MPSFFAVMHYANLPLRLTSFPPLPRPGLVLAATEIVRTFREDSAGLRSTVKHKSPAEKRPGLFVVVLRRTQKLGSDTVGDGVIVIAGVVADPEPASIRFQGVRHAGFLICREILPRVVTSER